MTPVLLVDHGRRGHEDRVRAFFRAAGVPVVDALPCEGEALPEAEGIAGAVVFGGPFAVFEEARFPFLRDEARLIAGCLDRDLPLLGICQGAQQIARVLGAEVGPLPGAPHEFGYVAVAPTDEGRALMPAPLHLAQHHWHGFDLPRGARLLATGALFPHQAFGTGRALGFQFHAEATPAIFRDWQDRPDAPWGWPGAQDRATQDALMAAHDAAQADWFAAVLARLFAPVLEAAGAAVP